MSKKIDTLIEDIHSLFGNTEHIVNKENLDIFSNNISKIVEKRLKDVRSNERPNLRLSKLGTPARKLWFEVNTWQEGQESRGISADNAIKFLYGDLIEELVLFLAREAGHKVEGEQEEIMIEGVLGHRDCKIDGITTDIKSTSKFSFPKFQNGSLLSDDPFGYIAQISSYSFADKSPYGAFVALNKETGQLALLKINPVDMINPVEKIKRARATLELSEPPVEKCYLPKVHGKQGNEVLHNNCSYCAFKHECWKDANGGVGIRKFKYSDGIKEFVTVIEEPRVEEVT